MLQMTSKKKNETSLDFKNINFSYLLFFGMH